MITPRDFDPHREDIDRPQDPWSPSKQPRHRATAPEVAEEFRPRHGAPKHRADEPEAGPRLTHPASAQQSHTHIQRFLEETR